MPTRNRHFTGRGAMLRELRRLLTADVTALVPHSLQGLGGVGKSQLAIEYAYRFAADYDLVWWIPAERPASVRQSLADLARRLDLAGPGAEQSDLINAARDALRTGQPYQRWLLIFDNAERSDDIRSLLLEGPGHTLITSRDQRWGDQADVLDVDVYSRPESTQFLLRRVPGLSASEAGQLANELGDLPLALDQAAAWLSLTGMRVEEYLPLIRARISELLNVQLPAGYPLSVAASWEISMNRLGEEVPAATQLLEICAFIGPDPISLSLFTSAPPGLLPEPLAARIESNAGRLEILNAVSAYSLARIEPGAVSGPSVHQHRLVQAVIRESSDASRHAANRLIAHQMLAAAASGSPHSPDSWPGYASLLPHVLSSDAISDPDPQVRQLIQDEVISLYDRGEYETGLNLADAALAAWALFLAPVEREMFVLRRERAKALRRLDRWTEALQTSQSSYDLGREQLGADHPLTLSAASGLAAAHRRLGAVRAAQELDQSILDHRMASLGPDNPSTLEAAHNVALNYRVTDDFPAALRIDQRNAEVYERLFGPTDLQTLFARNNVARDLRECGRYYESLTLEEVVHSQYHEIYGPENPETLRAMKNLAVSRRKAGRYKEAHELAGRVLERHIHKLGPRNVETLAAMTNFANDHRCLGLHVAGRGLAEEAVRGFRETLGDDHPFTAAVKVNLAALIRLCGDPAAARELNSDALATLRNGLGEDHRYTLSCQVNLASDLAAMGQHEAARGLNEDSLARLKRTSGENHPYTLSCALNLALDLRAAGERERFRDLLREVLDRYHATLGGSHPEAQLAAARERASCDIEPPPV
jgi:tetratricopeptide (TPR) repeat protein